METLYSIWLNFWHSVFSEETFNSLAEYPIRESYELIRLDHIIPLVINALPLITLLAFIFGLFSMFKVLVFWRK